MLDYCHQWIYAFCAIDKYVAFGVIEISEIGPSIYIIWEITEPNFLTSSFEFLIGILETFIHISGVP